MERNDSDSVGGNAANEAAGANEFSGSGSDDRNFDFSGTAGSTEGQGAKERAKAALSNAGDKLADVGSGLRDKAGVARDRLVVALETGADRLRERGSGATLAGATAEGSTVPVTSDGKMGQVTDKVATGMQATADWLKEADVADIKSGIERQVKEHPGRTLLIAAGLGYLIGRAFRNNQ